MDRRDVVAAQLGVSGRLAARRERYRLEWWLAEKEWIDTPPASRNYRRPGPTQLALVPDVGTNRHGAHPRNAKGARDFHVARQIVEGMWSGSGDTVAVRAGSKRSSIEVLVERVLGGRLVGTEKIRPERSSKDATIGLVLIA